MNTAIVTAGFPPSSYWLSDLSGSIFMLIGLAKESSPLSVATPGQPGGIGIHGERSNRASASRRPADFSFDWVFGPVIGCPRDGSRELRERGDSRGCSNENFVAIKVDREERPDLDSDLHERGAMLTGHGGLADERVSDA